jgi:hypothetical protein
MKRTDRQQHIELLESWGLTETDMEHIKYLTSFHDMGASIYRRKDTGQYYYVGHSDSWCDDQDDYFGWHYLTNEELVKYNLK